MPHLAAATLTLLTPVRLAAADAVGVSKDEVVVGMSTALSGPSQNLGQQMRAGVEAAFRQVNATGGVGGRKLTLKALDDGYEPGRAAPNMRKLIDEDHVFAVVGNVGTPTAVVSVPIANEKKVPFFAAFTGSGLLRKTPPDRYVLNYRASYGEETANMVKGLVNDLKIDPSQIALFTQNDAYGDAGFSGVIKALKDVGYKDTARVVHGRYQRNTTNIEDGLSRILDAKKLPKAVIMVGTYKACAKFIKLAKREHLDALFVNVSFVGSESLLSELGPVAEGVIVTQVVPPLDSAVPAVTDYKTAIAPQTPTFISLEGYLAGRSFADGLRRAGAEPTREGFIDALEAANDIDIGLGTKHALSKTAHQISHAVWPTIIRGGAYHSFSWPELAASTAKVGH